MIIVVLLILLPMIHMLAVSFSSDVYVMQGKVGLWPKGFTAKTYGYVFEDDRISVPTATPSCTPCWAPPSL